MKTNFNKLLIVTIAVVLCSALTVAGLAVSAATDHNAAFESSAGSVCETADHSTPALRDGVWKAEYEDGSAKYFITDAEEQSITILNPDEGIGVPSRYNYDSATGIYEMHIGSVENTEYWRVIDNNEKNAYVLNANGEIITLSFLSQNAEDYLPD